MRLKKTKEGKPAVPRHSPVPLSAGPKFCARLSLELQLKTIATALVPDDHAPPAPVRTGNMRFLMEIRDHFQSLATQGGFVFELHTVCIYHRSDIVRQVEEITRHVGFQMTAIHAGVAVLPAGKYGVGQRHRHHGAPNSQACGEDVQGICPRAARIPFILKSESDRRAVGIPILSWHQSPVLWAKRRMISPSMGSFTVSAASFAESHLTSRCSFSGHSLLCRLTLSGKTCTSHTVTPPFLRRF